MSRPLGVLALSLALLSGARSETPPAETAGFAHAPIRLDAAQRQAIGLTYGTAERRAVEKIVHAVGRLDYDERRLAQVTLKVAGYVDRLFVDYTGQPVRRGDPLLSIYSPELLTAEREYLLARQTEERLHESSLPEAHESAAALVRASRERLRLWDLSDAQVRELERRGAADVVETVHAPIAGVVVERLVTAGQRLEPGMTLYRIADLSSIWAWADVYEQDLAFVQVGQEATITLSSYPGETFSARVAYVAPMLDAKTRTARVRFDLRNSPDQRLRPEMHGRVELHVPAGERLVVPETAILDSGRRQVVFVDAGDGRLVPREVRLGDRFADWVEVREGVAAGERLVTSGNFLVDSESKLEAAESMMGMMGALGMADMRMQSARPMEMGGGEPAPTPAAQEKIVGDLHVAVYPAGETVGVGDNAVRVRLRDASGAPVTGARVSLTYTMDMPGMAIEEASARELGDGLYEANVRFAMAGPWGLVVQIERPGQSAVREKFTLRVAP